MHILVISHMYPSNNRPVTGIFIHQQVKALTKLNHRVTVICPTPWIPNWLPGLPQHWKVYQRLPRIECDGKVEIHFRRGLVIPSMMDRWRGRMYFLSLRRFILRLVTNNNFDLIHAHTALTSGDLGQILKKKYKLPLIITMHGGDIFRKALLSYKNYMRILFILSRADSITVVSRKLNNKIISMNDKQYKLPEIKTIYNGLEIENFGSSVNWDTNDKTFKFLSIGGLFRQKNYELIMQVIKELINKYPNIKYQIIGEGRDRKYYENKIKTLNLENVITLTGALPHVKAMDILKESDVFILTSVNEGFGVVYLEAMYYGLLTIGSKGEAIEEVIRHGENGFLVNPHEPRELRKLLSDVLEGKYNIENIGRMAKKTVWPRFSWKNNARAYEKIYRAIIADNREMG